MSDTIIEIGSEYDLVHLRYADLPGKPEEITEAARKMAMGHGVNHGATAIEARLEDTNQRRRVFEPEFVRIADESGEIGVLSCADGKWVWSPTA